MGGRTRGARWVLAAWLTGGAPAWGGGELPPPDPVVPAVEGLALNLVLWATLSSTSELADYHVHWPEMLSEYPVRAWEYDTDHFVTNQLSHPYHGTVPFIAARSTGVPFGTAALYPLVSSFQWEVFMEDQAPSVNDQVATTLGGIVLGEALFRAGELSRLEGGPMGRVGSVLLAPAAAVNRGLFGERFDATRLDPGWWTARGSVGWMPAGSLSVAGHEGPLDSRVYLAGELRQWALADGGVLRPFDAFVISGSFATAPARLDAVDSAAASQWSLLSRGLLFGKAARLGERAHGSWGLVGGHDYDEASALRISTHHLGLGLSGEVALPAQTAVRGEILGSWVVFGSASAMGAPEELADWFWGPSAQGLLDVELDLSRRASLRLELREYRLAGPIEAPRVEWITRGQATVSVRLTRTLSLAAQAEVADRLMLDTAEGDLQQQARFTRLLLTKSATSP